MLENIEEITVVFDPSHKSPLSHLSDADKLFIRRSVSGTSPLHNKTYLTSAPNSDQALPDLAALRLGKTPPRLKLVEHLSRGSLGAVYRGFLEGTQDSNGDSCTFVLKIVANEDKIVLLRHEAIIYQYARHLQGTILPRYHGLFENEKRTVGFILLEDCGKPYDQALGGLPDDTKLSLMQSLKQLHDSGIEHGDLQSWNILDHRGSLRIVDWHLAMVHECPARNQVMTEEYCSREAVHELACEELATVGERLMFRSQETIVYG